MTQQSVSLLTKLYSTNTLPNLLRPLQESSVLQYLAFLLHFHRTNHKRMMILRRNTRSRKIRERKRSWRNRIPRQSLKRKPTHYLPSTNCGSMWNLTCMDRQWKHMIIFSRRPWPISAKRKRKITWSQGKSFDFLFI